MRNIRITTLLMLALTGCDDSRGPERTLTRGAPIDTSPASPAPVVTAADTQKEKSKTTVERGPKDEEANDSKSVESAIPLTQVNAEKKQKDDKPAPERGTATAGAAGEPDPPGAPDSNGYTPITLAWLSDYEYLTPEGKEIKPRPADGSVWDCKNQIPAAIRGINEKKVVVRGYMVPIEIENGRVKAFVLSNNRLYCCFGVTPWMNEWISVRLPEGETADFVNDLMVTVYGTISIGEDIEEGWVLSLYRMLADRVTYRTGI